MFGDATAPTPTSGAEPEPARIEAAVQPGPETVAVQEIAAIQPPLPREVQTEWAEANADLLAVEDARTTPGGTDHARA